MPYQGRLILIGVTGMIIVLLSTPLFVLASMNWSNHHPVDYEVKVDVNETVCSYLKQSDLKNHVLLSLCNRDGEIILDIRMFMNQTAIICGIPLNIRQWNALKRVSASMNRAIEETTEGGNRLVRTCKPGQNSCLRWIFLVFFQPNSLPCSFKECVTGW